MNGMVRIKCTIELPSGKCFTLHYAIDEMQAAELNLGRRPPEFDPWTVRKWEQAQERADALARMIATTLAHKLVQAVGPTGPET